MSETVYCYNGTFEGFLCCTFDSYLYRETPCGSPPPGKMPQGVTRYR